MRRVIFEPDAKFNADVVATMKAMGCEPVRTAYRSPWQNGVAEPWVGSVRRDLLDHVIVLNQRHLEEVDEKLHPLLSRRPDSSWTREGHPQRPSSNVCVAQQP